MRNVRSADPPQPGWRVEASDADVQVLIGWLEPALTATRKRLPVGGAHRTRQARGSCPWKTRGDALVHLIASLDELYEIATELG